VIEPGQIVVATRDGGHDRYNLPKVRPIAGRTYRVETIYNMRYGLGCTLSGMDPAPYRGYLLLVNPGMGSMREGWYFKPVEVADSQWTEEFMTFLRSKDYEPIRDK
jgi:hypothetical protein